MSEQDFTVEQLTELIDSATEWATFASAMSMQIPISKAQALIAVRRGAQLQAGSHWKSHKFVKGLHWDHYKIAEDRRLFIIL